MAGARKKQRKISVEEEKDIVVELNNLSLEWSELTVSLKNFAKSFILPQPILICEGKYEEWGPNTEDDPDLYPLLFALCRRFKFWIEAQCVKISPPGKKTPVGPKFQIGDDFDGWFEIVSEDGHPLFQIESVSDLASHSSKPFVLMKSMHAHKFRDGEWESCTLDIGYEIKVGSWMSDFIAVRGCGCGKLLQCTSFAGEEVYLPSSEPGRFSLMGEGYLSGPQTISSLSSKKFPLNVELMEGSPRPTDFEGFVPTLVLGQVDFEEVLVVWPMQKDVPLVHIPTKCPMELKTLDNLESLRALPVYDEIVRRINSFLPKNVTRPRWYQHTQSSLVQSLLQKTSTTASRRRYTTRARPATSSTEIRPPSTSIDIHQPSTSGYFRTTSTDTPQPSTSGYFKPISTNIDQPSTSGYFRTTSTDIDQPSCCYFKPISPDIDQPSTSGYFRTTSTDIDQPSTSDFFKTTSTDIYLPSTSDYFETISTDIPPPYPSWFSTSTTTASGPLTLTTTNIQRPSFSGSPTTYVQHSSQTSRQNTTTDIHQPCTSGLQSSSSAFQTWASERFSKHSRSLVTKISDEIDHQQHESDSADAHRNDEIRSVEMESMKTDVDHQASRCSSDMFRTLNIDSKSSGDDPRTSSSDASQKGNLCPKPIGGMGNQKTYAQAVLQPSRNSALSRFGTTIQKDDQKTYAQAVLQPRRKRIETQQQNHNQESPGNADAELRRFRLELLDDIDDQWTSDHATFRHSSGTIHPYLIDPLSPESREGDETPSIDPSVKIDPYDEIDEIYVENKRTYHERCNIPLEKETFL